MSFPVIRLGLVSAGALCLFGICLSAESPAAAQAVTTSTNGSSSSSNGYSDIWADKTKIAPTYADVAGARCTGGSGVTVCPTMKSAGDPKAIQDILGSITSRELKIGFCVSTQGVPEDPKITLSSGRERADREMLKFIKSYRYNPGTVDGVPARLCGVEAAFKF
ncbi:MAG TPA: hypothetical protein VGO52_13345 [Hyphomonadaceae bacterium]|jgi:outer membrane biosynthesis protein TonB|nr:hypothetical protein [Hyphomonadaceae bacterium]